MLPPIYSVIENPLYSRETIDDNLTNRFKIGSGRSKEIFGEDYTALKKRNEVDNRIQTLFKVVLISSLLAIILPIQLSTSMTFSSYFKLIKVSVSVAFLSGSLLLFTHKYMSWAKTGIKIKICKKITNFSNLFEDFKNNPQESKIKKLFDTFDKITFLLDPPYFRQYNNQNKELQGSVGKVFLMDALVKLLKNPSLLDEWNYTVQVTKDSGFSKPWKDFKINNPNMVGYIGFLKERNNFKSIEIADKMIEAFKGII